MMTSAAFLWGASVAHAQKLIVPIGGLTADSLPTLPKYIEAIYKWGIGAAALLGVLMLVAGGLQYVLSAGNFGSTEAAKSRMMSAVYGILILLGASIILGLISNKLTALSQVSVKKLVAPDLLVDFSDINHVTGNLQSQDLTSEQGRSNSADILNYALNYAFDDESSAIAAAFNSTFENQYGPAYKQKMGDEMKALYQSKGWAEPTPADIENRYNTRRADAYREVMNKIKNPPQAMKDAYISYSTFGPTTGE